MRKTLRSGRMDGWMGGWMGGKARLRIAYSNQKEIENNQFYYGKVGWLFLSILEQCVKFDSALRPPTSKLDLFRSVKT